MTEPETPPVAPPPELPPAPGPRQTWDDVPVDVPPPETQDRS
jgi:hypothetical protein